MSVERQAAEQRRCLLCHALTGDAHVTLVRAVLALSTTGRLVVDELDRSGHERIDTDRYFVVCVNVLGGCQGSTGSWIGSIRQRAEPYGCVDSRSVSRSATSCAPRSMSRRPARHLTSWLSVDRWLDGRHGSALEWAVMYPDRVALAS